MRRKCEQIKNILSEMVQIMRSEGDSNWIPGLESIVAMIENALKRGDDLEAVIKDAYRDYGRMYAGANSFGDYFIWRDSVEERIKANEHFDRLKTDLAKILDGCIDSFYPGHN